MSPVTALPTDQQSTAAALVIRISSGTGTGATRVSAFDAALGAAGVGDFNLLRLSSIIPARSAVIEVSGPQQLRGAYGDRLYCVYADAYASTRDEQAWAGVGWSVRTDGSGEGLFVEQAGTTGAGLSSDLRVSLYELADRRGGAFSAGETVTSSIRCGDAPVCAVVVATFRLAPWSIDEP